MTPTFAALGLNDALLTSLSDLGFTTPTPIQSKVIPLLLNEKTDMINLAQTGTGKTAAFGLPLIQLVNAKKRYPQALVLCPTRELCVQVSRDLTSFASGLRNLHITAVYGGANIERQIQALRKGSQVIVATPGRLNDLILRGKVDISNIEYVVLDEADEMLQMGFKEELDAILANTPAEKNTLLFSATMPKEIAYIAKKYMVDPVEVTVGARNAGSEQVSHEYYLVRPGNRYAALRRIVDFAPDIYSIIFCRTRQETQETADKLSRDGYNADALHGDLSQAQRDYVMRRFREKRLQLLVATDVAARGLDVNDLTHVINYNLPDDIANYTHRSGRTGRAGREGISVAIIHPRERYRIKTLERTLKKKFIRAEIPSGPDICRKQILSYVDGISAEKTMSEDIETLYREVADRFENMDREELIKRFLSNRFDKFLQDYQGAPDLNTGLENDRRSGRRDASGKHKSAKKFSGKEKGYTRFFLNVGRKDGLLPQRLIGTINSTPGGSRIKVGRIDIRSHSAVLEADSRYIPQVLGAFSHLRINGKPVSIEPAGSGSDHRQGRPAPHKRYNKKGRGPKARGTRA